MKFKIIRKDDQKTATWSGGTTTELYIYPENSIYKDRNFEFRISSAKVEIEKSKFTLLPNVSRIIMPLDGKLKLSHKKDKIKTLKQFESYNFSGDQNTTSYGKVTDFNLMTTGNKKGELKTIHLNFNDIYEIKALSKNEFNAFYVYKGEIEIDAQKLYPGDFFIMQDKCKEIFINSLRKTVLISAFIV